VPQEGQRTNGWKSLHGAAFAHAKDAAMAAAKPGTFAGVRNDFSLAATPATQTVGQGSSATYVVTVGVTSGQAQAVRFSVSGLPSGAKGTFTPTSVTGSGSSTLRVTTTATTPVGSRTLKITAKGSSATHSTTVSLTVVAPVANDFSIGASPSSLSLAPGAAGTSAIGTAVTSGVAQTVALTVSGVPSGATASLNPTSVTAGNSSTLTVNAGSAAAGPYTLTVTGTGTSAIHSTTVSLTVTGAVSGPTASPSWNGQYQGGIAPPDPTGAIGPNGYIELINLRYGIYGRDGTLVPAAGSEGDLGALTGLPVGDLSDPQILWDPGAQRFYYLALDVATFGFAFGYSTTANHQTGADFCKYILDFGYGGTLFGSLPDYPKLGVTRDFVLIGSNVFLLGAYYTGSNVNWMVKPTDPACPGSLGAGGTFSGLRNADGSQTSTPVPAVSADPSGTGYVVGSVDPGTGTGSALSVFKVTRDPSTGYAAISGPNPIIVPAYSMPASAPQPGVTAVIDTMDTRLTHAVAAYDPNLGATAVWTAHTVFGGAGAEGRWYEINVGGTPSLAQSGTVSDPNLFVWNGAISPNRRTTARPGPSGATW
jgi:hypothetical protein